MTKLSKFTTGTLLLLCHGNSFLGFSILTKLLKFSNGLYIIMDFSVIALS